MTRKPRQTRHKPKNRSPRRLVISGALLLWEAFWAFLKDGGFSLAGAVAFYSALSLGPLLIILLWVTSLFGDDTQQALIGQVQALIGVEAGRGVELVVENAARRPQLGTLAGIFGLATLVFASTTVFAQLQYAMNVIWGVEAKPGHSVWDWFRTRLMSLGMVVSLLFLLVLSLGISTTISVVMGLLSGQLSFLGVMMPILDFLTSLVIFTLLFALIFKYLPDVNVTWRQVWLGAGVTAVLFGIGKILIGIYLGQTSVGSAYGAAGSLVVLLIWVNISTIILFFGAEITQIVSRRLGFRMTPNRYAIWVDPEKRDAMADDGPKIEPSSTDHSAD